MFKLSKLKIFLIRLMSVASGLIKKVLNYPLSTINFQLIMLAVSLVFLTQPIFTQTPWWTQQVGTSDINNTNNGNNGYVGIGTDIVRSPLITKLQLFMPWNPAPAYDRLSILLEGGILQNCKSIGELAIAKAPYIFPNPIFYSSLALDGDVVLRAGGSMGMITHELDDCTGI